MLYIMRHGKTDWNAVHRLQGSEDIPLNEEGRQMARDARKKYGDLRFDICYCSPSVSYTHLDVYKRQIVVIRYLLGL